MRGVICDLLFGFVCLSTIVMSDRGLGRGARPCCCLLLFVVIVVVVVVVFVVIDVVDCVV